MGLHSCWVDESLELIVEVLKSFIGLTAIIEQARKDGSPITVDSLNLGYVENHVGC
jgi:hypothetical protein